MVVRFDDLVPHTLSGAIYRRSWQQYTRIEPWPTRHSNTRPIWDCGCGRPTSNALFADAAQGPVFDNRLAGLDPARATDSVRFELAADAIDLLLFDWLNELLYAYESRRMLLSRFDVQVRRQSALGRGLWRTGRRQPPRARTRGQGDHVSRTESRTKRATAGWPKSSSTFDVDGRSADQAPTWASTYGPLGITAIVASGRTRPASRPRPVRRWARFRRTACRASRPAGRR